MSGKFQPKIGCFGTGKAGLGWKCSHTFDYSDCCPPCCLCVVSTSLCHCCFLRWLMLPCVKFCAEECDDYAWLRTHFVGEVFLMSTKYV